jgi:nucleoside phosphorylase
VILVTFAVPFESAVFRKETGDAPGLTILHTGVGAESARRTFGAALGIGDFSHVIVSGFAGGLVDDLEIGDLITGTEDQGPTSPARVVRLVESDRVLGDPSQKRALAETTRGQAVDMETATILAICRQRGIPATVWRVISDDVNSSLVVPGEILAAAARRPICGTLRLLAHLAPRPTKWGAFRAMVANCDAARIVLAKTLPDLIAQLR